MEKMFKKIAFLIVAAALIFCVSCTMIGSAVWGQDMLRFVSPALADLLKSNVREKDVTTYLIDGFEVRIVAVDDGTDMVMVLTIRDTVANRISADSIVGLSISNVFPRNISLDKPRYDANNGMLTQGVFINSMMLSDILGFHELWLSYLRVDNYDLITYDQQGIYTFVSTVSMNIIKNASCEMELDFSDSEWNWEKFNSWSINVRAVELSSFAVCLTTTSYDIWTIPVDIVLESGEVRTVFHPYKNYKSFTVDALYTTDSGIYYQYSFWICSDQLAMDVINTNQIEAVLVGGYRIDL